VQTGYFGSADRHLAASVGCSVAIEAEGAAGLTRTTLYQRSDPDSRRQMCLPMIARTCGSLSFQIRAL
jgi:hypothetical protein